MFRLFCAAVLASVLAAPTAGQVAIRVVDSNGRPVPAVRVDVLGRGELIGVASTSMEGVAELDFERSSEAQRITLTHLGFQTLIVQVKDLPADRVIQLEPEPQALAIEGFTVEVRSLCPIDDDAHARWLWSEVASRYSTETGSRAWFAYLSRYGGSAREEDLHRVPDSRFVNQIAAGGPGVTHGDDFARYSLDDLISTEGYAWPPLVIGGTKRGRDRAWAYPELDWVHAYHFAGPVFGALHDFAVASESEGQTTLAFCENRRGGGATINGTISLLPGDAFVAAEWHFETAERDEDVGGAVSFTSYVERPGAKPHLVASRGVFYRRRGGDGPYPDIPATFARFGTARLRWHLLPSADQPCNTGISFYSDPPRTPQGVRFTECVIERFLDKR